LSAATLRTALREAEVRKISCSWSLDSNNQGDIADCSDAAAASPAIAPKVIAMDKPTAGR
jgi:hypothetical protein